MKLQLSIAKCISLLVIWLLTILGMTTFAADPSFSIVPASTGLKLHCNYIMWVMINPNNIGYNWFESHIKFNNVVAAINHISVNPFFTTSFTGYIKYWFLYKATGWSTVWTNIPLQASTFWFKTTRNVASTTLEFTNVTGWTITYDKNTTDDGAVINSSISSLDILTWVTNVTYTFTPVPCILDNEAPLMANNYPSNNATNIPAGAIISFLLYDWAWPWIVSWPAPLGSNNRQHYWYSWLNSTTLSNYQTAPSTVDNQEWVNSWSIRVNLSCPTCVWWSWPYILSGSSLTTSAWTGDASKNKYTRNSKDRWYIVSFPAPAPYEIEKLITVSVSERDNANENGSVHTGTHVFSFNAPVPPTITRIIPSTSINIEPTIDPIVFVFSDAWAWVNPWTIQITIPQIISWSIFYTGYTYSGSDLSIILTGGSAGTWNAGTYQVSFSPKRPLPSNTVIRLTWLVYDYANNPWTYDQIFTTKMSCEDWWCLDFFTLNILWGTNIGSYPFTWHLIVITWTNNDSLYPYLTWIDNDILMCGRPYTWTILTGNIWIFDTTGTQINGILYTWDELYITWMDGVDFILSGGVVIIQ